MSTKKVMYISGGIIILVIALMVNPFVMISAGERGVILNWGAVSEIILGEGIHWRIPIAQKIKKVDVRIQKEEVEVGAASKDLQTVTSKVALNYHLDPSKVNVLWSQLGPDFKIRVIDPAIQEAVKAATAKYTAEELITKRPQVKDDVKIALTERLTKEFILVDEMSIVNFDFSSSFNAAIELKVTAEQQALAAKNKLEQIKFEAEQRVATAQAEAQAIRLQSDAANNEKYVALKAIEVQLEFAKHWNGALPTTMIPSNAIPFLNLK